MAKNDFQYGGWNYYTLQCNTIMTLISPGDCTLQCGMWLWNRDNEFTKCSTLQRDTLLWDDMPLNAPKRLPYWNLTSVFDFDHITTVDMSFCTSLQNVIQIGPFSAEKNYVMSIIIIITITDLYSAFRSEDTEALGF